MSRTPFAPLKHSGSLALCALAMAHSVQAHAAPPVSAYAGHYPYDTVQGVPFWQNPNVRSAVETAVKDAQILDFIFDEDNVVVPIREARGRYVTGGYDPRTGGDTNWSVLIVADGSKAAVCFSSGVEQDVSGSDWYLDGERVFTLYMKCPTDPEEINEALGDWPIGGVPG